MYKYILLILILFANNIAQQDYEKKILDVIPGAEYEANDIYELFFGSHWRSLWTTPIKVEILDLEKYDGGLTPIKKGGGFQTKSLRFISPNGIQWKFRSINKDPSKILPEELRKTLAADILKDQISSANPMAPLIASHLLEAVDVLQSKPILVYLADDEKLGEFRNDFKNTLGFIEIHPDELGDDSTTISGSDKIKSSYKLLETIEDKRSNKIDAKDFLKARLMDFLMNDWDRHSDQWRWARFKKDSLKIWSPIPRDRDQAFAKYTGAFPSLAALLVPQLNHFGNDFPKVKFQSWSGRYLDRRFLIGLSKSEWDSVTNFVVNKITDDVIDKAVKSMPLEYFELAGLELQEKLKSRRNKLTELSNDFYELTNEIAHIYCSKDKDFVEINFLNNESTEINIYKLDSKTLEKKEEPIFKKVLDNNITDEIRLFLLEDDDKVVIKGDFYSSPNLLIIGDKGKDTIENLGETDFIIYDDKKKTKVNSEYEIEIDESFPKLSNNPEIRFEPDYNQQGSDFQAFPLLAINSDEGILLGGIAEYWEFGFNKNPYQSYHKVDYYYSTLLESYSISYKGVFNNIFKNHAVILSASKTELSYGNFFGYGNETIYDKKLFEENYYNSRNEEVKISASILINRLSKWNTELGFSYWYYESQEINSQLLNSFPKTTYGLQGIKMISLDFSIKYSSVESENFPESGTKILFISNYFETSSIFPNHFLKLNFDLRTYTTFNFISKTTFALRGLAEQIIGKDFPIYLAPNLGGKNSLRGYERERFTGSGLLLFQSELRTHLGVFNLLFPFNYGLTLSAETGRVFVKEEYSTKWHPAYGAGIYATILDGQFGFSFVTAISKESAQFYLRTKIGF